MEENELKKLPDWAKAPFIRFLEDRLKVLYFHQLAIDGINIIYYSFTRVEELTAKLKELHGKAGIASPGKPDQSTKDEEFKKRAERARLEAEKGFPILHGQATIDLWGSIETLVKELVACWIENIPSAKESEGVRRVRIRLADYEAMSTEERLFYLVDELERDLGAPLKQGVNRFEALLGLFGLAGEIDEAVKRELFELSHVRNVIIHRRGLADKKLVAACPWLALKPGTPVIVTSTAYYRYFDAVTAYQAVLVHRVKQCLPAAQVLPVERAP